LTFTYYKKESLPTCCKYRRKRREKETSVKIPSNTLKKVTKDEFFAKKLSHLPKL
jgi:hypothetical protein